MISSLPFALFLWVTMCIASSTKVSWHLDLYPLEIAECLLTFVKLNAGVLTPVMSKELLGESFEGMLNRMQAGLALNGQMTEEDLVETTLHTLELRLATISTEYAIEWSAVEKLLERLRAPFLVMVKRSRPKGRWWPFGSSLPTRALPNYGRDFLLLSKSLDPKFLIEVLIRLADPLLLVLETIRLLGGSDFERARSVYQRKFEVLMPKAIQLAKSRQIPKLKLVDTSIPLPLKRIITSKAVKRTIKPVASLEFRPDHGESSEEESEELGQRLEQLITGHEDYESFGARNTFCTFNEVRRFVNSLMAGYQLMDVYMSLATQKTTTQRILSKTFEMILINDKDSMLTLLTKSRFKIPSGHLCKFIFPLYIADCWLLAVLNLGTGEGLRSSVSIYAPVVPKQEVDLKKIGQGVLSAVETFIETKADGRVLTWNPVSIIDLPKVETRTTRSSVLVMALAKRIVTAVSDRIAVPDFDLAAVDILGEILTNKIS